MKDWPVKKAEYLLRLLRGAHFILRFGDRSTRRHDGGPGTGQNLLLKGSTAHSVLSRRDGHPEIDQVSARRGRMHPVHAAFCISAASSPGFATRRFAALLNQLLVLLNQLPPLLNQLQAVLN
jgi:hypothetical protein